MKSRKKLRDLKNIELTLKQNMRISLGAGALLLFSGFLIDNVFMKLLGIVAFGMVLLLYYNRQIIVAIEEALN